MTVYDIVHPPCGQVVATRDLAIAHRCPAATFNVRDYGAKGDGETDDSQAILRAVAAAEGRPVQFPAGAYRIPAPLAIPAGSILTGPAVNPRAYPVAGCDEPLAWLRGKVVFASGSLFSDLKIGDAGRAAIKNAAGASSTSFLHCHFKGGATGTSYAGVDSPTVYLGQSASCDNLLFKDCNVERPMGSELSGQGGGCHNVFTIQTANAASCLMHHITLDGCHLGVANATGRQGSPRMGLECVVSGAGTIRDVAVRETVIETTDSEPLDFSDLPGSRSTGILVEDCLIKGGGLGGFLPVGVVMELPLGFIFRNNTVWRSKTRCFQTTDRSSGQYPARVGGVITGNTFDFTVANGVAPVRDYAIILRLDGYQFTGNTVKLNYNVPAALGLRDSHGSTVTGNTAQLGGRKFVAEYDGSSSNTIANNVVS